MRPFVTAIISGLVAPLSLLGEDLPQALTVDAPATWEVEFKGDRGVPFYIVKRKDGDPALLMFSRWPVSGNVNQIDELLTSIADGFVAAAGNNKEIKIKTTDYKIEKIDGDEFSGSFASFGIEGGFVQSMFMIGDDEGIWSGQFTGTPERWTEALAILKTLKKKA